MSFDDDDVDRISRILSSPKTPLNLLKTTYQMILDVSIHTPGILLLSKKDCNILNKSIESLQKSSDSSIIEIILSILVNVSADSHLLCEKIIKYDFLTKNCVQISKRLDTFDPKLHLRCLQVFSNLSRQCPKMVNIAFEKHWNTYITDILSNSYQRLFALEIFN